MIDEKEPQEVAKNKSFIPVLFIFFVLIVVAPFFVYYSTDKGAKNSNQKNIEQESIIPEPLMQEPEIVESHLSGFNLVKPVFAQVEKIISNIKLNNIKPNVPAKKIAVSEIANLDSFTEEENINFSDSQKQALEDTGFFLTENNIITDQSDWEAKDDFVDTYKVFDGSSNKYYRKQNNALFISSDLALHLYHILIDRSFQKIEEVKFQPMLRGMTRVLFFDSINKYNQESDETLKQSYKRLSAYYLIPLVILDASDKTTAQELKPEDFDTYAQYMDAVDKQKIAESQQDLVFSLDEKEYDGIALSDEVYELAKSELDLIQEAKGKGPSPLFTPLRREFENDYSQFKPRSHYTKNDILKSYFISMMWYGRMGFVIKSPDLTRDALIMTGQINTLEVGEEKLSKMWSDMSAVIEFFVGEEDDLTAYQYTEMIRKVYGDNISVQDFTDEEKLNEFIQKVKTDLPNPKIISESLALYDDGGERERLLAETKQFRFMGQRFTPDAYIINNLTQGVGTPDPETGQKLPTMPTALMPLNIIEPENKTVQSYLDKWINDPARIAEQKRESDKIIAKVSKRLQTEFAGYGDDVWTQNIYWSWLNCFRPLLSEYGQGYPLFMQTEDWQKKNLGTVLGSFTELKHDTLLYAKQSYAELGGGGNNPTEIPPIVKGYVEPDLVFWSRILTLAETTQKGLEERDILPYEFKERYKIFIESTEFFKQIVEKELENKEIKEDDFEKLRVINNTLTRIVAPLPGEDLTQKEKRAGIIADIHTDAVNQKILYEATGKPFIVYVAVSDTNGTRLTRGVVYNHYELKDSLDTRLTDEDWQAKVYDGNGGLPALDEWTAELIK